MKTVWHLPTFENETTKRRFLEQRVTELCGSNVIWTFDSQKNLLMAKPVFLDATDPVACDVFTFRMVYYKNSLQTITWVYTNHFGDPDPHVNWESTKLELTTADNLSKFLTFLKEKLQKKTIQSAVLYNLFKEKLISVDYNTAKNAFFELLNNDQTVPWDIKLLTKIDWTQAFIDFCDQNLALLKPLKKDENGF